MQYHCPKAPRTVDSSSSTHSPAPGAARLPRSHERTGQRRHRMLTPSASVASYREDGGVQLHGWTCNERREGCQGPVPSSRPRTATAPGQRCAPPSLLAVAPPLYAPICDTMTVKCPRSNRQRTQTLPLATCHHSVRIRPVGLVWNGDPPLGRAVSSLPGERRRHRIRSGRGACNSLAPETAFTRSSRA